MVAMALYCHHNLPYNDDHDTVWRLVCRQQRARWVARLASVRLSSRPPWQQERRVVGMVASPAENTAIVLLKLQDPVQMSDFARAACLAAPSPDLGAGAGAGRCLALGWDSATGELRTQPLAAAPRAHCAEDTEVSLVTRLRLG